MIIEIFAYISVGTITIAYLMVLVNDFIQKLTKTKNAKLEKEEE
ncbi:MAG: hypothetical protein ACFFDW_05135 [Candidatus Thorarchaeota archaeon]